MSGMMLMVDTYQLPLISFTINYVFWRGTTRGVNIIFFYAILLKMFVRNYAMKGKLTINIQNISYVAT